MIYLWKIEGEQLVLNLREILKYDNLSTIYKRDTSPGKNLAHRDFRYIDFISCRDGIPCSKGYTKSEAHKFAVKHSGMPSTYTPDIVMTKAIETAKDLNTGLVEELIDATVSAFRVDAKLMIHVKELIEKSADNVDKAEDVESIMKMTQIIMQMSSDIPSKITRLLALREEYNKAIVKSDEMRGGGDVGNSYEGTGIEKSNDTGEVESLD